MARREKPAHQQPALIPNLVPRVVIDLTLHLDGPGNEVHVGFTVSDFWTEETLAITVLSDVIGLEQWLTRATLALEDAHRIAMSYLSPF